MKIEGTGMSAEMTGRAAISAAARAVGKKSPEKENDPSEKEYSRGRDIYIPADEENAGIYEQVSEEGRAVIRFTPMEEDTPKPGDDRNDPKQPENDPRSNDDNAPKSEDGSKPERSKEGKKPEDSKKSESCTGNTDKVDREIKALREKLRKLKEQAARAEGKRQKELESKIAALENELAMKDTDSYRRQHSEFH